MVLTSPRIAILWSCLVALGLVSAPDGSSVPMQPQFTNQWRFLGPDNLGGNISQVLPDPVRPARMALRIGGNVWVSSDSSASWTRLSTLPVGLRGLARSPVEADYLIGTPVFGFAGLYESSDGGTTWRLLPGSDTRFTAVTDVVFTGDGALLVRNNTTVHRSADRGASWEQVAITNGNNSGIQCTSSGVSLCVIPGYRPQRSVNGGVTWTSVVMPDPEMWLSSVTFGRNGDVYAATSVSAPTQYHLLRSVDSGASFAIVRTDAAWLYPRWVSPTNSSTLIASDAEGLRRSVDGGLTFTTIAAPFTGNGIHAVVNDSAFDGTSNRHVYVGTTTGLQRAADILNTSGDVGWMNRSAGITEARITSFGAPSTTSVVAIASGRDIIRLTDGSQSAVVALSYADRPDVGAINMTVDQLGSYVYVSESVGSTQQSPRLWRSSDAGATFAEVPGYPGGSVVGARGGTLFAMDARAMRRTADARGVAPVWSTISELPEATPTVNLSFVEAQVAPGGAGVLLFQRQSSPAGNCCTQALFRIDQATSDQPAASLIRSPTSRGNRFSVTAADAAGQVIYSAEDFGFPSEASRIWRTDSAGAAWTQVSAGIADRALVQELTVHPRNPNWVFASTAVGLFQSIDGGVTWTQRSPPVAVDGALAWRGYTLLAAASGVWALDVDGLPATAIDEPSATAVGQPFRISGWAIDTADATGTGVDAVHIYAFPNPGSGQAPMFLGAAAYGALRSDVGSAYGHARFGPSGFSLMVQNLAAGPYEFVVYQHSTFSGEFRASTFRANVLAPGSGRPFGVVDTPTQGAANIQGAIGVTGWALDDSGIADVQVYRECLPFDISASCQVVDGHHVIYIGTADRVLGARPDVAAAFPGYPQGDRAGWGFQILTTMLPHVPGGRLFGGQGPITLYVFATGLDGRRTLLGRSSTDNVPTSISLNNDALEGPFGTIDTPGQGETVSGVIANFGWVLTPDSNTTADGTDILVPVDGATVEVHIDSARVGTVTFNQCRGTVGNPVPPGAYCNDDVASIFGHVTPQPVLALRSANVTRYRNLDAGRGAIGAYVIDTRLLSTGLHSISWVARDSAGRTAGLGSRNFIVNNQ
jgi:hypothetical protein